MSSLNMTFNRKPTLVKIERLRELFKNRPQTVATAAKALSLSGEQTRLYIKKLKELKEIHRCGFVREGETGLPSPQYALGNKKDVPLPKKKTEEQVQKAYRKKRDADPEKRLAYLEKRKAEWLLRRKPKMDKTVAALFGKSKKQD